MAGTPTNAALWQNADVYIKPYDSANTGPSDVSTPWAVGWEPVGLLDGDEGFTMSREEESNEFYAWGGILVRKTKSKHKRTIKFVCLEENDTVFSLINPGSDTPSTSDGVTTATVKIPANIDISVGLELRDGNKVKRRFIKRATIESIDEIKESEAGLTAYGVTVVILPESDGTLYTEVSGDVIASTT